MLHDKTEDEKKNIKVHGDNGRFYYKKGINI